MNNALFALAIVVSLSACAKAPSSPPDKDPIVAALAHFQQQPMWMPKSAEGQDHQVLVVKRQYEEISGMLSAGQLAMDVRPESWVVPEDARLDIERRGSEKPPFPDLPFPAYVRLVDDLGRFGLFEDSELFERHPDARACLELWPPGFTADGRHALVCFMFGPTSHGAKAVYLLELRDGLWHVQHHRLAYYA